MEDRKDLAMRNQRSFSLEFKRRVVEELLSEESHPAYPTYQENYNNLVITCHQFSEAWKEDYARCK